MTVKLISRMLKAMPINEGWKFLRENFDKLLLVALFLFTVGITLHISHDSMDKELILWARENTNTIIGALLGLITGHALASASKITTTTSSGGEPPLVVQNSTETTPAQ